MKVVDLKLLVKKTCLSLVLQEETAECGHACIIMISNFLGHNIDLYTLRKLSNTTSRGTNLLEISHLFERLDFNTRALRVSLADLNKIQTPAILHWNMNHFVVLKKVTKNYVVIHDPALGVRKCALDEVSKLFSGIVLEVEKAADFTPIDHKKSLTLYELFKSVKGINRFIGLLILLSLALEILNLLNPLFIQFVTDDVIGSNSSSNLYTLASAFFLLLLVQVFVEYSRGHMVVYVTNHLTAQFSTNIVQHLLKLPLEFFEKRHKGDIQSKFQTVDLIQKKMSTDFINTILDGLMIIINVLVMAIYNLSLTFLVLSTLLLYWFIRYSSYHVLKKQTEASIHQHARSNSEFLETLQGIVPIKAFLKEKARFNIWRNSYISSLNADIRIAKINVAYSAISQLLFHLEHLGVVCLGAFFVLSNQFSIGMLIAFLAYRALLINKAASFIQNVFDYKLIAIQLNRLSDILFQHPEVTTIGSGSRVSVKGALALKNIYFKYNSSDNYVLADINLQINAGEKVAIVGSSGCGKSTFLKVIMGLLHPYHGEMFIDDIPIKEFGSKNYRELTASVMQEDTLLSGSILDNIAFFAEEIDLNHVHDVAKIACIHETINRFPMGYETLVGDMGSTISGGQKQRILLARALYKKPKLLFLDEATSHLDSENEKNINLSLKSLAITQIIIAHRQETIRMADRIINLESINHLKKLS